MGAEAIISCMAMKTEERIKTMAFGEIYPLYVAKVERKGRTVAELDEVIGWLTGFSPEQIAAHVEAKTLYPEFFAAATINPNASLITGSICGVKIQEITDPLYQQVRYLDKLVDELAKGRPLEKIKRS